jgi:hypothetical protein
LRCARITLLVSDRPGAPPPGKNREITDAQADKIETGQTRANRNKTENRDRLKIDKIKRLNNLTPEFGEKNI